MFPPRERLTIQFAHPCYRLAERFALHQTGIAHFQTWTLDDTLARLADAHVLVISGFWDDALLASARSLRYIQVSAAGFDRFGLEALRERGLRLANGRGINANAVSEHAMGLITTLLRQIHLGRDNQHKRHWRGMISDLTAREDELAGKTILICGAGVIGGRLARLARAFDTTVIGIKRDLSHYAPAFHEIHPPSDLLSLLPRADVVVLTCPLTEETRSLIDAEALALMKPTAYLINVARGGCVEESALIEALETGQIAGAGIDVTAIEPLAEASQLWSFDNVILTPHTAGETRRYEDNLIDILLENIDRLSRGESSLRNQIV